MAGRYINLFLGVGRARVWGLEIVLLRCRSLALLISLGAYFLLASGRSALDNYSELFVLRGDLLRGSSAPSSIVGF